MIREFKQSDTDAIIRAYYNASRLAHPFLEEEFLQVVMRDIPEKYLPNTETWVVDQQAGVVGFISLMGNMVAALFLEPAFHGKGLGKALMDRAVLEKGALEVDVFKRNALGRLFYSEYGFVEQSEFLHEETGEICLRMSFRPDDPV